MLSRTLLSKNLFQRASPLTSVAARGVYTDETRPYVFINEHTKVICQGMTGKHVSYPSNQYLAQRSLRTHFGCATYHLVQILCLFYDDH